MGNWTLLNPLCCQVLIPCVKFSLQMAVLPGMSCPVLVVFRWEALSMWHHLQTQTTYFKSTWHFQNLGTWCLNIRFSSQPNDIREKFELFPEDVSDFPFSRKEWVSNKTESSHGLAIFCLFIKIFSSSARIRLEIHSGKNWFFFFLILSSWFQRYRKYYLHAVLTTAFSLPNFT